MGSGVATRVSLEEFLSNPDIHYYDFHELHNGEVVVVSPPSEAHSELQERLESLLRSLLSGHGFRVRREYYYTVASNGRRADVAAVMETRRQTDKEKVFRGGPDLVIEVLSPMNTTLDLDNLRLECFREGTQQFWVINRDLKTVTVYKRPNLIAMYDLINTDIHLDDFAPRSVLSLTAVFI